MKTKSVLSIVLFTAVTCSFSALSSFSQCMMEEVPLAERARSAAMIIEGTVVEQSTYWNSAHTNIFTSSMVEVYKIFKGKTADARVEVITEGGIVGFDMERVDPGLQLGNGQTGIFFLESCKDLGNLDEEKRFSAAAFRPYAGMQGFILYDLEERTAIEPFHKYVDIESEIYTSIYKETEKKYVELKHFALAEKNKTVPTPGSLAPSISSFSPASITAGTFSVLTINGSGFGATKGSSVVKFKNADNGGASYVQPDASQYISWSDAQIKVQAPVQVSGSTGNAGTGTIQVTVGGITATSGSALNVQFGVFNIQWPQSAGNPIHQMNCVDYNGSGGITIQFNTSFASNTGAVAAFTRALNSWKCGSFVNWTIGANTSINSQASDGTTVVRFSKSGELSAGVNATTNSWWSGCAPAGDIWYLKDWDLVYNAGKNWNYTTNAPTSSQNDFESTTLHELGHAQLLTHVNQSSDVMYWATSPGIMLRTVTPDALSAASSVMERAAVPQACGPGAMTLMNPGNCAVDVHSNPENTDAVTVFPNPSAGLFKISMGDRNSNGSKVEIFNALGEKVGEQRPSGPEFTADLTSQPSGVYMMQVSSEQGERYFKKLIKE